MSPRVKKPIGTLVLLIGLVVYAGAAGWLGAHLGGGKLLELGFFVVAGIVWIFPARYLIQWMTRPPEA